MKTPLLLLVLLASLLFLNSCTSVGEATGFTRAVPVSVAKGGKLAVFKYRFLEIPDEWDRSFDPLEEPGSNWGVELTDAQLVERIHRRHFRLITENIAYGIAEDMREDWVAPVDETFTP